MDARMKRPSRAHGGALPEISPEVERAARILAAAFGHGQSWGCSDLPGSVDPAMFDEGGGLSIRRRGRVEETATKGIRRLRSWRGLGVTVWPSCCPSRDPIRALAGAGLDGPLAAWLTIYALQDFRQWGTVVWYAEAMGHSKAATSDAAARILWRRAEVAIDDRARMLRMRASDYRRLTRAAEFTLRDWLERAAKRFNAALGE